MRERLHQTSIRPWLRQHPTLSSESPTTLSASADPGLTWELTRKLTTIRSRQPTTKEPVRDSIPVVLPREDEAQLPLCEKQLGECASSSPTSASSDLEGLHATGFGTPSFMTPRRLSIEKLQSYWTREAGDDAETLLTCSAAPSLQPSMPHLNGESTTQNLELEQEASGNCSSPPTITEALDHEPNGASELGDPNWKPHTKTTQCLVQDKSNIPTTETCREKPDDNSAAPSPSLTTAPDSTGPPGQNPNTNTRSDEGVHASRKNHDLDPAAAKQRPKQITLPPRVPLTQARRPRIATPGIMAPRLPTIQENLARPVLLPPAAAKKHGKIVNYPPHKQYPPAPAYPQRDTPAWARPDTQMPPRRVKSTSTSRPSSVVQTQTQTQKQTQMWCTGSCREIIQHVLRRCRCTTPDSDSDSDSDSDADAEGEVEVAVRGGTKGRGDIPDEMLGVVNRKEVRGLERGEGEKHVVGRRWESCLGLWGCADGHGRR